jgi:hypothetical protein
MFRPTKPPSGINHLIMTAAETYCKKRRKYCTMYIDISYCGDGMKLHLIRYTVLFLKYLAFSLGVCIEVTI